MFKSIAVIGSGTMGSGIAGQVANAGHEVLLLDLPGSDDASPNAIAAAAVQRLLASEPPGLMHPNVAARITVGNTRDDLDALGQADWIIEAVVERLPIKQDLYRRLAKIISPNCIVTSNTSTIPISLLMEGMPEEFQQRFAITHYFNPVRYMRLLELVRGKETLNAVIEQLAEFNDRSLGKGVVRCDDTPGFLGNRVGVFALQVGIDEAVRTGISIESADALMGRPMGIPKTGIFGLYDLIGIDLMADVVRSLKSILPEGDAFHAVGEDNPMIEAMIASGLTGLKGKGGFYRRDEHGAKLSRQLSSGEYQIAATELPVRARKAAAMINEGIEPLTDLIIGDDASALFCRRVLARVLGYAAGLLGEVTSTPQAIDDAMKLGFNWNRGPFEMIDAIGVPTVAQLLEEIGADVPACLATDQPFYSVVDGQLHTRVASGADEPVSLPEGVVRFHLKRRTLKPLLENRAASLFSIEDDLRLVEFHSKANALTDESMQVVAAAAQDPGRGILIHNDAQHYSAGVDLNAFLTLIDASDWAGIDAFLHRFQQAVLGLKYSPVPVIGAPSGLALGGGLEVLLHADALVMHSNSVVGLVESGVGLLPAGGGVKETWLRWHSLLDDWEEAAWKTWMNIGYGRTAHSPATAERLAYYRPSIDSSVMNRDRLYAVAVQRLNELAVDYTARERPSFQLGSASLLQRMQDFMDEGVKKGDFTSHNRTVAMTIGRILCADEEDTSEVSEENILRRERMGFVELARTGQTRSAIAGLLGV